MTEEEMLKLERLETDDQNDQAVLYIDNHLRMLSQEELETGHHPELDKLSDLVYEFEERTDILYRKFRI